MANSDSTKVASDQNRESYADDAKARRVMQVDSSGNVGGFGLRGVFGEQIVSNNTSVIQLDGVYGVLERVETFTTGTGTVTLDDNQFTCATGATLGSYAVVRSKRAIRYRPGQGVVFRFTSLFPDAGVENSLLAVGCGNLVDSLFFGYNGTSFGVLRQRGGKPEIQRLTVTGAAGGSENATVRINGTDLTVPLTSGTVQHNAFEIASFDYSSVGYRAFSNNDTVIFQAEVTTAATGTFTFTSGTATGTFAQVTAGQAKTDYFTPQASWNVDPMDGTGPSGLTLDVTKGNVYQIQFQYLGFGVIKYAIENPSTGEFQIVHKEQYPNANTETNLSNPTMKLSLVAASLGSTTDLSVKGASAYAAIEGGINAFWLPRGFSTTRSVATTDLPILSIRDRAEINGIVNLKEITPELITVASDGGKPVEVRILLNATIDEPNWQYISQGNSAAEYDESATTVSGGTLIASFVVPGTGQADFNFSGLNAFLGREDILTISVVRPSGAGNDVAVGFTWQED